MAEEQEAIGDSQDPEESKADPIKNLKSEFSRKQENVINELSQLKQQLAQLNNNMQRPAAPQKEEDEIDPVIDPKGYKEKIKREMRQEMEYMNQSQNQKNNILGSLVQSYPELSDSNSELTKAAIMAYNSLSEQEKAMPNAYKLAVTSAAADLGVLTMNKRKQTNQSSEDFVGSSSGGQGTKRQSQKDDTELDDKTLAFAELLGRPVNDKKYLESLKAASKRKWGQYK